MFDVLNALYFLLWFFVYMFICCVIGYFKYERGENE